MVTLFHQRVPLAVLLEVFLESAFFFLAILVPLTMMQASVGHELSRLVTPPLLFAGSLVVVNGLLGTYKLEHVIGQWKSRFLLRKSVALLLGLPIGYLSLQLALEPEILQGTLALSMPLALMGVVLVHEFIVSGIRSEVLTHRVLVVGVGIDAVTVGQALAARESVGVQVVGYYPVDSGEPAAVDAQRILPKSMSLDTTVTRLRIQEVIVAVKQQRGGLMPLRELINCRLGGVRVTSLPTFFERYRGEIPIESVKASWLIYSEGFRQDWWRTFTKRTFDVTASTLLLIPAIPTMLLVSAAIALESSGPIVIRQERVGLGGRPFKLLKLRSMRIDAESEGAPQWASANDSRVTRVGRFIRRTRIDELPQLVNILKGEMSFVGPRPERPYFVNMLTDKIPFYATRHSLKPGLTGWAQVSYTYGASIEDAMKKLQYDLYYVKNHTLLMDTLILFKTLRVVLSGKGAH
jgi:sugar transferase (PEP-CTERM system associated)